MISVSRRLEYLTLLLPGLLGLLLMDSEESGLWGSVLSIPFVLFLLVTSVELSGRPSKPLRMSLLASGCVLLVRSVSSSPLPYGRELGGVLFLLGLAGALYWAALQVRFGLNRKGHSGRLSLAAGTAALAAYLAPLPWHVAYRPPNGDEPYYLLIAWSLVQDQDLNLADEYRENVAQLWGLQNLQPQPGDPTGPAGEVYSRHDPLYALWLAPFLALGGVLGARFGNALLAALGSGLFLRAVSTLPGVTPRGVFRSWALFTFLSPWTLYAPQLWPETAAGTLLLASLLPWLAPREPRSRTLGKEVLLTLLFLGATMALKLRFALLVLPVAAVILSRLAPRPRLQRYLGAGVAVFGVLLLAANYFSFGNPLKLYGWDALWPEGAQPLRGLLGLFLDGTFGLLAVAPIGLLMIPEVVKGLLSPKKHPLGPWLWAALPYLLAIAARREWYGGWSPPFRYALVLLPVFFLSWATHLSRPSFSFERLLGPAALAGTGLLLTLYCLLPEWAYHLANGSNHWIDRLSSRFEADLLRFFPSAVRSNLALAVWAATMVPFLTGGRFLGKGSRCGWIRTPFSFALVYSLLALVLIAGHRLPTRVVELEDPHVRSRGAGIYPELWLPDRTRFPGALILPEHAEAWVKPVAGGNRVSLSLRWSRIQNDPTPLALEIWIDQQLAALLPPPPPGGFSLSRVGPLPWSPGATLRFRTSAPPAAPPRNGLVLDRVEFQWE